MAFFESNPMFSDIRGRLGDLVFRQYNGRTIVSRRPAPSPRKPTDKQFERQERFCRAAAYGRDVCSDPQQREKYERVTGKLGVYPVAVRDFLRPPEVTDIIDAEYEGVVGNQIRVYATDDTKVAGVTVTLRNTAGKILERAEAAEAEYYWSYRAKTALRRGDTVTIEATARDLAGNTATLRKEVEI